MSVPAPNEKPLARDQTDAAGRTFGGGEPLDDWEHLMKATKRNTRSVGATVKRVVRTTVGDLIAAMVDAVGSDHAQDLLTARSPLQKVLRQRLVLA
jgi:hypothetical protein